jgi:hypothetical protein
MATTSSITVDAALKARLTDLAGQAGLEVNVFVGALLRRIAETDVRFERGVPGFPRRAGAPVLTVEDVDRLADGPVAVLTRGGLAKSNECLMHQLLLAMDAVDYATLIDQTGCGKLLQTNSLFGQNPASRSEISTRP